MIILIRSQTDGNLLGNDVVAVFNEKKQIFDFFGGNPNANPLTLTLAVCMYFEDLNSRTVHDLAVLKYKTQRLALL